MTQLEIAAFLKEGALLRIPSSLGASASVDSEAQVLIWSGPFKSQEDKNSQEFSVAYQDFFGSQSTQLLANKATLISVKDLKKACNAYLAENSAEKPSLNRKDFQEPELSKFQEAFQVIQGKIHRGEVEKAVPVVFAESSKIPKAGDRAKLLDHVLEAFHELYVFGFWNEEQGMIGATPETLFHLKENKIQSMALAGTAPKGDESRLSLLKDPKEMHEHQLVLSDIQERLSKWGAPQISATEIVEYPSLSHLRTKITVQASSVTPQEIIKSLHPTPALGVSPRNYGYQWMRELSYQAERNLFGAPITFRISSNETLSLVAIRNLHWHSGKSFIGSGCGLVASSDLQREWKELATKRETVFKVLGL